jgi:hypothetical protein
MAQTSILVEVHVKTRLVGDDALTEKLVGRTTDGAALRVPAVWSTLSPLTPPARLLAAPDP